MLRFDFIKGLLGISAMTALRPEELFRAERSFSLLETPVAGFQYYSGPELIHLIKEGDPVELIREPENRYDPSAIALYFRNEKIGFIPRCNNKVLSRLMDQESMSLWGVITFIDIDESPYNAIELKVMSRFSQA